MENVISWIVIVIFGTVLIVFISLLAIAKRAFMRNRPSRMTAKLYGLLAKLNQGNSGAYSYGYARALRNLHDMQHSEQAYREALKPADAQPDAFFELAAMLEQKGDRAGAYGVYASLQNSKHVHELTPTEEALLQNKLASLAPRQ